MSIEWIDRREPSINPFDGCCRLYTFYDRNNRSTRLDRIDRRLSRIISVRSSGPGREQSSDARPGPCSDTITVRSREGLVTWALEWMQWWTRRKQRLSVSERRSKDLANRGSVNITAMNTRLTWNTSKLTSCFTQSCRPIAHAVTGCVMITATIQ